MGLPPGPRLPLWLQTLLFVFAPVSFFAWCERRFPGAYTLRLFYWGRIVFVSDLPSIKRLLAIDAGVVHANEPLEPLFGASSPMLLDGEAHARLRRALLPHLRGARLERYGRLTAEAARADLERWPVGRPFRLLPRMRRVAAEVIMGVILGDATSGRRPRLLRLVVTFTRLGSSRAMLFPILRHDLGRFSPWGYFLRMRRELDGILLEEIEARRRRGPEAAGDDLLAALVWSRDGQGRPLTDAEIRDQVVSLLFAGYETSAVTFCWCLDLVLHVPGLASRLRAAIDAGDDVAVNAIVKEVLRLRTIIVAVGRRLTRPLVLAGHELPAGTHVAANIAQVHRDASLFAEPLDFRPERFAGEPAGWLAFGGGTHRCPGMSPALVGARAVLRTVLSCADIRPADPRPERIALGGVVAAPHNGVRVVLESRR